MDEKWPDKNVDKREEKEERERITVASIVVPTRYKYGSCPRGNSTLLRSSVSPSHIRLVPAFIRELSLGPPRPVLIILIPFSKTIHDSWRYRVKYKRIPRKLKFITENIFIPPLRYRLRT